jgi:hypothetical protein
MNTVDANIGGAKRCEGESSLADCAGAASMAVGSLQYPYHMKGDDLASGEMIYLLDVLIRIRHMVGVSLPRVR